MKTLLILWHLYLFFTLISLFLYFFFTIILISFLFFSLIYLLLHQFLYLLQLALDLIRFAIHPLSFPSRCCPDRRMRQHNRCATDRTILTRQKLPLNWNRAFFFWKSLANRSRKTLSLLISKKWNTHTPLPHYTITLLKVCRRVCVIGSSVNAHPSLHWTSALLLQLSYCRA